MLATVVGGHAAAFSVIVVVIVFPIFSDGAVPMVTGVWLHSCNRSKWQ